MTVKAFDSVLRVHVSSETRPEIEHLVELDAFDGLGRCSCEDFQFRSEPLAAPREGGPGDRSEGLRCKHIVAAREWLAREIELAETADAERLAATFSNDPE